MKTRSVKPLPAWLPIVILVVVLMVAAGYALYFNKINKKRVVNLYLAKANSSKLHDEYGLATDALQQAISLDPQNIQAQTEQLKIKILKIAQENDSLNQLLNLEKIDEAEASCKKLLAADPQSAELTALLGIVYAQKDRPELAIQTYQKASELNPGSPNIQNYWGYTMVQWQFPADWKTLATQKFNKAKELDPTYVNPHINLAKLALNDGKFDDAISILKQAEEIGRKNEILYTLWGSVLDQSGEQIEARDKIAANQKFSEALERYRIAETLNPKLLLAHYNRARTLGALQSYDAAIAEYEKALELEPSFVLAHVGLAIVLYERNAQSTDLQEALNHLNQAMSFTDQTIQQYQERKGRTTDAHARTKLDEWTGNRKDNKNYFGIIIQAVKAKQSGKRDSNTPNN